MGCETMQVNKRGGSAQKPRSKMICTSSEICPFLRRMSKPLLVSPSCLYAKNISSAVWEMHLERIIITDIQLDCS
jgi:hypothetical protein